jgi:uncharacterized protein YndB with AHSA1/START domain
MSKWAPIVVEQQLRAPPERVWRAITDPREMCRWFFESITSFEPRSGFETRFEVRSGDRVYAHHWTVTVALADHRLVYDWSYDGLPGASFVEWDLIETRDGTKLTLTHTGGETFPQDDPAFSREAGVAGWSYFICQRLPAFLSGS